jgi:hypothetical protein
MAEPLSPAAQAVAEPLNHPEVVQIILDAANGASSWGPDDPLNDARLIATAAIRALASAAGSAKHWHRDQLRAIAAELEGGATTTTTPQEAQ